MSAGLRPAATTSTAEAGLQTRLLATQHGKQLRHRSSRHRISPVGRDLGQRLQYESPLSEPRVRHDETRCIDDFVVVQNQIQIECPRRTRVRAFATEALLDVEQRDENLSRRQRRLPHRRGVQENRLIADADRRRVMKARIPERRNVRPNRVKGRAQVGFAIAKVASKRNRDSGQVFYSCQRVGRTTPTRSAPIVRRPMTSSMPDAACSNRR